MASGPAAGEGGAGVGPDGVGEDGASADAAASGARAGTSGHRVRVAISPAPAAPTTRPATKAAPARSRYSWRIAGVPAATMSASSVTSQLVRRMHPCDSVLPMAEGSGVPWIP